MGIEITDDARPIQDHPFTGPTAFMLGNEVRHSATHPCKTELWRRLPLSSVVSYVAARALRRSKCVGQVVSCGAFVPQTTSRFVITCGGPQSAAF